jgi:hypothetical protein
MLKIQICHYSTRNISDIGMTLVIQLSEHVIPEVAKLIHEYFKMRWRPYDMSPGAQAITNFITPSTTPEALQNKIVENNATSMEPYHLHYGGRCGWTALEAAVAYGNVSLTRWILQQPVTTWEGFCARDGFWQTSPEQTQESVPSIREIWSRDLLKLTSDTKNPRARGPPISKSSDQVYALLELLR